MAKSHEIAEYLMVGFAFLLILSVISFGGTAGLAVIGIVEASRNNTCKLTSPQVECIPASPLFTTSGENVGIVQGASTLYLFWMAGATGCGVLWAIINTITVACLSEIIRTNGKEKKDRHTAKHNRAIKDNDTSGAAIELQPANEETSLRMRSTTKSRPVIRKAAVDEVKAVVDNIGGYQEYEFLKHHLRPFSFLPMVFMFMSSLFVILAILCMLWGIALSFSYGQQHQRSIAFFIIVDILTTILLPTLLCAGFGFFAVVTDYITVGHIDLRIIIPQVVSIVKLESGDKYDYWVINDTFYFPLRKRNDRIKHGFFYSFDTSPATWFLAAIICSAIYLTLSLFVDVTLDEQRSVTSCNSEFINPSFDCFSATTFDFVDCANVNVTGTKLLHCFRFLEFGLDSNILTAISSSYAFYLLTIRIFMQLFYLVHDLLQIRPTRLWGVGFLIVGLILYAASIATTVLWARGITVGALNLSIVHIVQIFMVSSFISFMGLLLLTTVWFEKIKSKAHTQATKVPLVHYTDCDKRRILEIGGMDEDKWKCSDDDADMD